MFRAIYGPKGVGHRFANKRKTIEEVLLDSYKPKKLNSMV
jgi:hypothetical protein